MVVNEAFAVGVPVIASSQCGAGDLIQSGINGYVFRSEAAEDLRDCLRRFLNQREHWAAWRAAAERTAQTISVQAAAAYFVQCLRHMTEPSTPRPVPPWMQLALAPSAER
jgi:glycosyltransferase involved in cell wall biosynthesis